MRKRKHWLVFASIPTFTSRNSRRGTWTALTSTIFTRCPQVVLWYYSFIVGKFVTVASKILLSYTLLIERERNVVCLHTWVTVLIRCKLQFCANRRKQRCMSSKENLVESLIARSAMIVTARWHGRMVFTLTDNVSSAALQCKRFGNRNASLMSPLSHSSLILLDI